ncbi:hypothetical protein Vsou_17840 [Vulcanisaeta souniana JCM 11219]|uniref:Uncharacterized protein n=1 Tax=Vulcanisaeta souniana JCM 11219 TaxID=1293586 RepID=A0A830EC00_9CREN|nr:hypothetical protein Vsou_17840 [Vulcanisaeta souniana JCM 11219]GGI84364.1 hypothetical protein GCM10007112_21640 [Vulcanisaeta souniana JCM 11219]
MQAVIVINMFGNNLGLVRDTLRAIKQINISDEAHLIISWSNPPPDYQGIAKLFEQDIQSPLTSLNSQKWAQVSSGI